MNRNLTIATWNCNGAFRRKFEHIAKLNADICVIQECENPEVTSDKNYKDWCRNFLWIGGNKNKGLGIFAKDHVQMTPLEWQTDGLKYFIAATINNDITLLAVWCHGADSPTFGYIGQLWKYLQINKSLLGNSIIAGDFNSNAIWDKWDRWWNHSDVVKELAELEIESLYHKIHEEEQGKESQPTFYLQRKLTKPYHIDYIFGSAIFQNSLTSLDIGKPADWLCLSDHMPVTVTVEY